MNRFTRVASLAVLTAIAGSANAISITLQPGPEGKDTQLVSNQPNTNFGNSQYSIENWFGNARSIGLFEFDLSAIGPAAVNSATLDLYHILNFNPGSTYNVYRITSAWGEATATFNTAPTFDAAEVASLTIAGDGESGVFRSWDVTSVVSGWINGAFANHGLWVEEIPVQGSATAYFSSSDGLAANRPRLNIDYTPGVTAVPEPAMLTLFGLGLALFGVSIRKIARRKVAA